MDDRATRRTPTRKRWLSRYGLDLDSNEVQLDASKAGVEKVRLDLHDMRMHPAAAQLLEDLADQIERFASTHASHGQPTLKAQLAEYARLAKWFNDRGVDGSFLEAAESLRRSIAFLRQEAVDLRKRYELAEAWAKDSRVRPADHAFNRMCFHLAEQAREQSGASPWRDVADALRYLGHSFEPGTDAAEVCRGAARRWAEMLASS